MPIDARTVHDPAEFLITTTPSIEGYQIVKTLEIVTAECVLGMSILVDMLAGLTDFLGGRSRSTQWVLRQARKTCLDELRKEAALLGANAVVGVDLDYSELSGQGKSMLFLVASGTAVIVQLGSPPAVIPSRPDHLDLADSQYRLYLTERYKLRKHEILGEFLAKGQLFPTVEKALESLHQNEVEEIAAAKRRKEEWLLQQEEKKAHAMSRLTLNDEETQRMIEYGIEFDGESFRFQEFKYEKFADAYNYARKQKK